MNPEHHMMSGHDSQRRQQEDLVAVLVYIMVSAEAGTQQSKETARRSSSSFGLYHGQRRSPVETHTKSLLQEEGSRAGRSLTPSTAMTASIPLEFTEKVLT